jgi:hypothetical protein
MPNRKLYEKVDGLCDYCSKKFGLRGVYIQRHKVENLVVCDSCNKLYKTTGRLYRINDMSGNKIGSKIYSKKREAERKSRINLIKTLPAEEVVKMINEELDKDMFDHARNSYCK